MRQAYIDGDWDALEQLVIRADEDGVTNLGTQLCVYFVVYVVSLSNCLDYCSVQYCLSIAKILALNSPCIYCLRFPVFDDYAECIDELNSCQWQVIYHGLTNDTIAVLSGELIDYYLIKIVMLHMHLMQ